VASALKKTLAFSLKFGISGALLYLVLSRAGAARVIGAVAEADPRAFAGAVGLFLFMVALTSMRWGLLLGGRFGRGLIYRLNLMGVFFNTFMPGIVGGDALKVYYLYRRSGQGVEAIASAFMDRYLGYAGLMCVGLVAYPFGVRFFAGTPVVWLLPGVLALFGAGSFAVFRLRMGRGIGVVGRMHEHFARYWGDRRVMARAFGLSVSVHLLSSVLVYVLAHGLGLDLPMRVVLIAVPIAATVSALPITLSGLGVREYAMVLVLGTQGVSAEQATALSFLWFVAVAAGGLPGALVYLAMKGEGGGGGVPSDPSD